MPQQKKIVLTECPCKEATTEAECEDCQDLPRGTFAYWRKLRENQIKGGT